MAKPILLLKLRSQLTEERFKAVKELLKSETDNEYHVIVDCSSLYKGVEIECINGNKGLRDEDIEELIKTINKRK